MSLCWKCRKDYDERFIRTKDTPYPPFIHCHDLDPEEEPKEKCWCDYCLALPRWYDPIKQEYRNYKYCPICGKKLED
jgi:hypothetical protein